MTGEPPDQGRAVFELRSLGLSGIVQVAAGLRTAAESSASFGDAAHAVVRGLHDRFVDATGQPALRLVRLFSTRHHDELDDRQRQSMTGGGDDPAPRFLTLEATAGTEPEGNARRVIPLTEESLAATPMIAELLADLDLSAADLMTGSVPPGRGRFGMAHVAEAEGSDRILNQDYVRRQGIASVLDFGGVLPTGDIFCVVMFSTVPITAEIAGLFRAVAVGVQAGLLAHPRGELPQPGSDARRDALRDHLQVLEEISREQAAELETAIRELRAEAELVDTLQVVGRRLTAQLDLDTLVQDATDAATKATRAEFGAFFYNLVNEYGESYTLYTLSGVSRAAFDGFPMPRNTAVFTPTFTGAGTIKSDDITKDPRYGRSAPYHGMPAGHLPVRSYLAVPVISPSTTEVLGGFFFGHPEPGRFTARHEQLAEGIAGYAAIGLDNARLFAAHRTLATELTRSMLPTVPSVIDLDIASRYLPAASGSEVGGDWFDVIELPAGRTAFVIGDVVGRGMAAAAVMGQMRTAVRAYALLDLPPAEVLRHASQVAGSTPGAAFITCFYAVLDPVDQTLTFANAGHLPGILTPPGARPRLIGQGLDVPLAVGDLFTQQQLPFPRGSQLTLYTDGLVENRERDIIAGLRQLLDDLARLPEYGDSPRVWDELIERFTGGRHDDDVALLHIRHTGGRRLVASMPLTSRRSVAAEARAFVGHQLTLWDLDELRDVAQTVATELVANAVRHTSDPDCLRLHHDGVQLAIEVADGGFAAPQLYQATADEEHHRGLYLVNAFADRWGSRATRDGKVVWAEIATRPKH